MNKWKEQLQKDKLTLKRLNRKQRAWFIWDYYKLPILSVLLALVLVISGVSIAAGSAKTAFYAVFVNANNEATADPFSPLLEEGGVDMQGKKVDIEANYTLQLPGQSMTDASTLQVLAALFGIGDMDVFAADEPVFASYAKQGAFVDLSLFIPEDVLVRYQDHLYYSEDEKGNRVLSGIWLDQDSVLHQAGYYSGKVLLGVVANAQNLDNAVTMMQQLMQSGKI